MWVVKGSRITTRRKFYMAQAPVRKSLVVKESREFPFTLTFTAFSRKISTLTATTINVYSRTSTESSRSKNDAICQS